MEKDKNRRLRFTYEDDVLFLREVVAQNPIMNPERWEIVQMNLEKLVAKQFQIRTLKQHLQLLLELWMAKEVVSTKKSGNEEPYSERDILLQEVSIICNETGAFKKKRKVVPKEKKISELGKEARERFALSFAETKNDNDSVLEDKLSTGNELIIPEDHDYINDTVENAVKEPFFRVEAAQMSEAGPSTRNILENMPETEQSTPLKNTQRNILGPTRRRYSNKNRPLKKDALGYLSEKNEKENIIRTKELELEERKISVEERKIALEERKMVLLEKKNEYENVERAQKMELEKERLKLELSERKLTNTLLESQQKIINSLLMKI